MKILASLFLCLCMLTSTYAQANEVRDRQIYLQITNEVRKMFTDQPDITVEVKDARVVVSGFVDTGAQRYVMDMIVKRNRDVVAYDNRLRIRGMREKTDLEWK